MNAKEFAADIARELRKHPERWTQGAAAKDKEGNSARVRSPAAVSWCLLGHIRRKHYLTRGAVGISNMLTADLVVTWNDAPERTVADVIALCEEVASSPDTGFERALAA